MEYWSNIQVSDQDPEVIKINDLEKKLGELPENVKKIRELITRFEVCHFKYRQHLKKIRDSISKLEPAVDPAKIGSSHVRHGESASKEDPTGRSLTGLQYIRALREWLNDNTPPEIPGNDNSKHGQQFKKWLGDQNTDKISLVRLLLARLTWDWPSYEKLQRGGELKELELQACRMDTCHWAFPGNLDLLLQGIGQLRPVKENEFEGCGSYNDNIRACLEQEFAELNTKLEALVIHGKSDRDDLTRAWLVACLSKTIKENLQLSIPVTLLQE
jgi:hypothetical protein